MFDHLLKKIFIVIQLQLSAFSPHPSNPPQIIFSVSNFGEMVFSYATGRRVHWLNMYEKLSKSKMSKHFNSVAYFYKVSFRCLHKSKQNCIDKLQVVIL